MFAKHPTHAPAPAEVQLEVVPTAKWKVFAAEIEALGKEIRQNAGPADFAQFKRHERWGRIASFLGYATAWILPNPISAFLISLGNFARWALVLHPVSHKTFDRMAEVPERYKSERFAKGTRRLLDWMDWITPQNWSVEHNQLHHYHLGSQKDPDVVIRNSRIMRQLPAGPLRFAAAFTMACVWKPVYYAVNTLAEARHQRGLLASNELSWNNWSPLTPEGRELWISCLIPYSLLRFVLLPAAFLPLGKAAALSVLINSLIAEVMTNLHSFAVIAPNHTGDDVFLFSGPAKGKADYYLRQIVGSVNYPAGGDLNDFFYGGMNYQIEHHLWPEFSLLQCRQARPRLKEICRRYGVRYIESPLLPRLLKTFKIMTGQARQIEISHAGDGS